MPTRTRIALSLFALLLLAVLSARTVHATQFAGPSTPIPRAPTSTQTRTPTIGPTPTSTSRGGFFVEAERWYSSPATPTPLAQPVANLYHLKESSETESANLVRLMVADAYTRNVLGPSGGRSNLYLSHQAVRLSAREALYRYPQAQDLTVLGWRLALTNTITHSYDSDNWIVEQVEMALNQRLASIQTLNEYLKHYGFKAEVYLDQIHNIYHDERVGLVLGIETADQTGGLFLLVTQNAQGEYECLRLYSIWDYNPFFEFSVSAEDFIGDGRPVIVVRINTYSGSMSFTNLYLYRWNGSHMVDIGRGEIASSNVNADPFEVRFLSGGQLEVRDFEIGVGQRLKKYQWDGQYLRLVSDQTEVRGTWTASYQFFFRRLLNQGEYVRLEELLTHTLQNEDLLADGRSAPDALRFLLAEVQALQGKEDQMLQTLREIKNSTADLTHPALRQAAAIFLQNYHTHADLLRACLAANRSMDWWLSAYPGYKEDSNLPERLQRSLLGHNLITTMPCPANPVFSSVLASFTPEQAKDPIQALKQLGVYVFDSKSILSSGGVNAWLIQMQTRPDTLNLEHWILISRQDKVYPIKLAGSSTGNQAGLRLQLTPIQLPGSNQPAFLFTDSDEAMIFWLNLTAKSPQVELLIHQYGEAPLKYYKDGDPRAIIYNNPISCYPEQWIYLWNQTEQQYSLHNYVEWLLFDQNQPDEAIAAIRNILTTISLKPEDTCYTYQRSAAARLFYLLALAQDLSHDPAAAASYTAVWRNFADTPYAVMARARLTP